MRNLGGAMNIFLSHNYKDKPVVEQIAIRLRNIYGEDSVFYDSWSIKPGEGIIDKMDEGLVKADYFFFFISRYSLASEMVKLEWQNALMRKTQKHKLQFIPVRLDESVVPAILTQTLYIDFYTNGFEVGICQIFDVLSGNKRNIPEFKELENLSAYREKIGSDGLCERLTINANYFVEFTARFLILINSEKDDLLLWTENCISDAFFMKGDLILPFSTIKQAVVLPIEVYRPLTKENPFVLDIKVKRLPDVKTNLIIGVLHNKGSESRKNIPLFDKK